MLEDRYVAVLGRPLRMVNFENKATWAKIYIVIENKTHFEIILWIDLGGSALVIFGLRSLFTVKNLFKLGSAVSRFEESRWNDDSIKFVFFFFGFGVR